MHGNRTEWSKRVDDSGVCPVCKATLHTRIRVLNHVRSSACRDEVGDLPEPLERLSRSTERPTLLRSATPAWTDEVLQLQEGAQQVMTARCVQDGSHGCDRPYAASLTVYRMSTCCTVRMMRATSLMVSGARTRAVDCELELGWRLRRSFFEFLLECAVPCVAHSGFS